MFRPLPYLLTLTALLIVVPGLGVLLAWQGYPRVGWAVGGVSEAAAAGWLVLGLIRYRSVGWVARLGWVATAWAGMAVFAAVLLAFDWRAGALAVGGLWAMGMLFFLGVLGIRLLLTPSHPILGVARTLIEGSIRGGAPLFFVAAVLLAAPALTLVVGQEERLTYRVQTFLSWSMILTSVGLSLLTIAVAAGSITSEVRDRQVFLTLTKPVARWQYLLGKWVGTVLLSGLLLAVAGGGIYMFARVLAEGEAMGAQDRGEVRETVLVARLVESPVPAEDGLLQERLEARLATLQGGGEVGVGEPGTPFEQIKPEVQSTLRAGVLSDWYTVAPRESQVYRFTGLGAVRGSGRGPTLTLKPRSASPLPDGKVRLHLSVNDGPPFLLQIPDDTRFTFAQIDPLTIDDAGELRVKVENPELAPGVLQPAIHFASDRGLELLYRVGGFEGNLVRSLLVLWVRLGFLAMIAVAAGAFLGFPVAVLLCVLVYLAAAGSGFLTESLSQYASLPAASPTLRDQMAGFFERVAQLAAEGNFPDLIKLFIRLVGQAFGFLVPPFSDYNPTPALTEGKLVPWSKVGWAVVQIGMLWTGLAAVAAWLLFRRRELARVVV